MSMVGVKPASSKRRMPPTCTFTYTVPSAPSAIDRTSGGPPQGVCHLSRPGADAKASSSASHPSSNRNRRAESAPTQTVCSVGRTQLSDAPSGPGATSSPSRKRPASPTAHQAPSCPTTWAIGHSGRTIAPSRSNTPRFVATNTSMIRAYVPGSAFAAGGECLDGLGDPPLTGLLRLGAGYLFHVIPLVAERQAVECAAGLRLGVESRGEVGRHLDLSGSGVELQFHLQLVACHHPCSLSVGSADSQPVLTTHRGDGVAIRVTVDRDLHGRSLAAAQGCNDLVGHHESRAGLAGQLQRSPKLHGRSPRCPAVVVCPRGRPVFDDTTQPTVEAERSRRHTLAAGFLM